MKTLILLSAMSLMACSGALQSDPGLCGPGYQQEIDATTGRASCVPIPQQPVQQDAATETSIPSWEVAPPVLTTIVPPSNPPPDCTKTMCVAGVGAVNVCTGGLADCDTSITQCQFIASNCPLDTSVCLVQIGPASRYAPTDVICGLGGDEFDWYITAAKKVECGTASTGKCPSGQLCSITDPSGDVLYGHCL